MNKELLSTYKYYIFGAGAVVKEYYMPVFNDFYILNRLTLNDISANNLSDIQKVYTECNCIQSDIFDFIESMNCTDCVAIVALPNALHFSVSAKLAAKGINVLCEKPLSL